MLTYPSDSLPQIVCPMDEDAIPPNPFCSAPLLPFSSITPSCANDGMSGHRRSGRIQGIRAQTSKKQRNTYSKAPQKPSRHNPSPTKRQGESGSMVQVSQSKQLRVESTHVHEKQNKDGLDFSFSGECQNKQKDQKTPCQKPDVSAAEDVVEQVADSTTQNLDTTNSDMDGCGGLAVGHAVENASVLGWVIGPLCQSFKSKMASFTEIVMSPVKLFRATSPPPSMDYPDKVTECEPQADGKSDVEPNNMFQPVGQIENGDQKAEANKQRISDVEGAQDSNTDVLKYSKKLVFDMESTHSSEQTDECGITQREKNSPVPLQDSPSPCIVPKQVSKSFGSVIRSSILLQPINLSASHNFKLKSSSAVEEQGKQAVRLTPLPGKRTGNRSELKKVISEPLISEVKKEESDPEISEEQFSQRNSGKSNKAKSSDADKTKSLSSVCYTDYLQPGGGGGDDDDDGKKNESSLVRQSLENSATGRTLKPTSQQLGQLNPDTSSAAGLGRSRRGMKLSCHSQELAKRKKLTGNISTEDTQNRELLNGASDSGLRPQRKEVVSTNDVDIEETLKPPRKKQAVSTRTNRKGKSGQEIFPEVLNTQTESSPDAMLICSLDKSSGVTENNQKSSSKTKPSGSCKRLKTRTGPGKPDVNIDSMDLETTVAYSSTKKPAQQQPSSEALVRPDIKQLHSTIKCRNINKKPLKRKLPDRASSLTNSDSSLVSTTSVLSMEPLEPTPTALNIPPSVQREENLKSELNQPSKRSKKGCRGAVRSSDSGATQETKQCINNLHLITKENRSKEGKGKISMDPVYFEMIPFESNHPPAHSPPRCLLECYVRLNKHEEQKSTIPVAGEVFSTDPEAGNHSSVSLSRLRASARRVNIKPRRADKERRRCRGLHRGTHKDEEMTNSITMEDADLATVSTRSTENGFSRRLLRSYSCPEIPYLGSHDTPWTSLLPSPHHSRTRTSHQHKPSHTPLVPPAHKSLRRARRHTVCSVEVEREIAPLCLRKEVYPTRRSAPYDVTQHLSPGLALSPSTSLSVLASCFLSSPLAFLSKKVDSRGAAASPSTSSHVSSPTSSSSLTPPLSSIWHLSGFLQSSDSSRATSDSSCSGNPLECEIERRQQSEEEEDGEDTSSSSQEYEDVALREEKALSDSEIKVVQKNEERGKVSSIRIRKTLPKPQTNLTPMGLPKPIRLKKKDFSLEEIYTNKNFSKPPESRLETIFEVPLSRRNGSESCFGQRRVKRFLEFLEVGEARKIKKPLVGVGKAGVSSSRTRRGGFAKDEPSLSVQDVDSLLCAKLDQLKLWLIHDQKDS
ncbi:uncharacterized protein LOC111217460 isoform X1 [Seriola dumerili]|uniref:Uncharacterized LOC111217460 n=2 Tax=Seriola dumerili TaxID=41447 RepID=A0A3B4VLT6_SERDU|nr:uncharacterized protein LOC111217460 isoform X1 [Seriola dumerili]